MDLEALVTDELRGEEIAGYALEWFEVQASSRRPPHATRRGAAARRRAGGGLVHRRRPDRRDAGARSTRRRGVHPKLRDFKIGAVTEGQDALGEVSMVVEVDGRSGSGQAVSTDIIEAAARAYVRALSVARARALRTADAVGLPATAP